MPKNKEKKNTITSVPKLILFIAHLLEKLNPNWAVAFAKRLFVSPIRHKIPKREWEMDKQSTQELLYIPSINKKIMTYRYGSSEKKVLLVHGWSGRGTQLVKIADALLKDGFSTVSFDAPAHGKSPGNTTLMPEFIASILEIEKQMGPFEFVVGHSLGGMSILNAIKQGLQVKKAVIIGSGDSVQDIIDDFIKKLKLKPIMGDKMRISFEKQYDMDMESFSANVAAKEVTVPVLVIHDKDDDDVPFTASVNIDKHLANSELMLTEKFGHRKVLGDDEVVQAVCKFIEV